MKRIAILILILFLTGCSSAMNETITSTLIATATHKTVPPASTPTEMVVFHLPIERNFEVNRFNQLAYISPDDAVSSAFESFLNQHESAGNINYFQDIKSLDGYGFGSGRWEPRDSNELPTAIVEIANPDYKNGTFADPLRRPIVQQAYFRTSLNNIDYLLIVTKVHNNNGSEVRLKLVLRYDQLVKRWDKYFNPANMGKIILPRQYPDTMIPNLDAVGPDENYLSTYWNLHKREMLALVDQMQAGNLQFPPEFGNYLWEATLQPTKP